MGEPSHLRPVPDPPGSEGGGTGGGNGSFERRLTRLETEFGHLATKKDVSDLKVWILSGLIAGMAAAAVIALGALRFVVTPPPSPQPIVIHTQGASANQPPTQK